MKKQVLLFSTIFGLATVGSTAIALTNTNSSVALTASNVAKKPKHTDNTHGPYQHHIHFSWRLDGCDTYFHINTNGNTLDNNYDSIYQVLLENNYTTTNNNNFFPVDDDNSFYRNDPVWGVIADPTQNAILIQVDNPHAKDGWVCYSVPRNCECDDSIQTKQEVEVVGNDGGTFNLKSQEMVLNTVTPINKQNFYTYASPNHTDLDHAWKCSGGYQGYSLSKFYFDPYSWIPTFCIFSGFGDWDGGITPISIDSINTITPTLINF